MKNDNKIERNNWLHLENIPFYFNKFKQKYA